MVVYTCDILLSITRSEWLPKVRANTPSLFVVEPGHLVSYMCVGSYRSDHIIIYMAVCQNLVPLVNIKIAGKWMFIPLKMVCIGIDP